MKGLKITNDERWVERGSEEWHRMWANLALKVDAQRTRDGEQWQYMGTWNERHEFRHRAYTVDERGIHQRRYERIEA